MPGPQAQNGPPRSATRRSGGGAKDRVEEVLQLIIAYAKQETLEPVTRQAKALGRGLIGAVLLSLGTVFLGIGFLRALQAEFGSAGGSLPQVTVSVSPSVGGGSTSSGGLVSVNSAASMLPYGVGHHLSGDWSWVPYMGGALFAVLVAVFCVTRILRGGEDR
ncbi:MAG TPA: hypothetical protein VME20_05275 [Acidimicrobiales bacterium]|nr:hypothetical protein [Acidimicrobiales bacterium]